jgi:hypothetical protein
MCFNENEELKAKSILIKKNPDLSGKTSDKFSDPNPDPDLVFSSPVISDQISVPSQLS